MSGSARTDADNVSSSLKQKRRSARGATSCGIRLLRSRGRSEERRQPGSRPERSIRKIDNFLPSWLEWGIVFQKGRQADWRRWAVRDQDSGVTDKERLGNGAPSH